MEALEHAGQDTSVRVGQRIAQRRTGGASALRVLVEAYLSYAHLDEVETGCALAALASEVPRQAADVRQAAARRVRGMLAAVQQALPAGAAAHAAASMAAQMVGALQLARALGSNAESRALLKAVRQSLLSAYDAEPASSPPERGQGPQSPRRRGGGGR